MSKPFVPPTQNLSPQFRFTLGLDWGKKHHQFSLYDRQTHAILRQEQVSTAPLSLYQALEDILRTYHVQPHQIAIAIETSNGPLVEMLLQEGYGVYSINPLQLKSLRQGMGAADHKSDARDAYVLAWALVHCPASFRALEAIDEDLVRLREMERHYQQLTKQHTALCLQLREYCTFLFPMLTVLVKEIASPWLWSLLVKLCDPCDTVALTDIADILKKHRIRCVKADQVWQSLHGGCYRLPTVRIEMLRARMTDLVGQLTLVHTQQRRVEKQLTQCLKITRTKNKIAAIVASVPGIGVHGEAALLGHAYTLLSQHDGPALCSLTGVSPVTEASGKRSGKYAFVKMRHACQKELRQALYHTAKTIIQKDEGFKGYYEQLRARGMAFNTAMRAVGRRVIAMLCAMIKSGRLYDPQRCTQTQKAA